MNELIEGHDRRIVVITDPHIKKKPGYHFYDDA